MPSTTISRTCRPARSIAGPGRTIRSTATSASSPHNTHSRPPIWRPSTIGSSWRSIEPPMRPRPHPRPSRWTRSAGCTPIRSRRRCSGSGKAFDPRSTATSGRRAGEPTMAETTYLEAIRQGLFEEMERDPEVLCLGEDIGAYGGAFKVTEGLQARFGERRVIDTPLSEAAIVGAAAGAAHMGMRPVCEMQFIDFISCAYDMLTNYVATARYRAFLPCPMVVRGPSGGYVRGGPFHSQNPEAAFLHTPGLKIVYPATASDAKGLLKAAIRDEDCVLFFEHKYLYRRIKAEMPAGDHVVPIGKARVAREGKDVSIMTYAATVRKTKRVLVLHEDTRTGGIAGEITARINESCFEWLDAPVLRVTAHDIPLPYAPQLEDFVLPQTSDIVRAVRRLAAY